MDPMRKRALRLGGVFVVCLLGLTGVAGAAGLAPQLRSPKGGKKLAAGHVKFTVYVPDPADAIAGHIFLVVSDKRIVKNGELRTPKHCGFRCDIATMKRVGHSHLYTYVDPYHFSGNWQDTPGKDFWQVYYYPKGGVIGTLNSGVGAFRIVG